MSNGKVVLLGAGPGQIDLISVKGLDYLRKADCIVYDRLVNDKLLLCTSSNCKKVYVGKENHRHTLPQDEINNLLYEMAKIHKLVVRLKGGDPYVFGRGGEEALFLSQKGIAVEVVPGISSSIAALELAGIPITHRGLAKGFQVITAHSRTDTASEIDFANLTDPDITLVFLMGLAHIRDIAENLIKVGRDFETPVAVISNGTTNYQRKVVGTLSNIATLVENASIKSPAIIVVGKVVSLESKLSFFENRPLFGKKYFLPTILNFNYSYELGIYRNYDNEIEDRLIDNGAQVIRLVSGEIAPKRIDLSFVSKIHKGDYLIFTSQNGVKAFFWNLMEAGLDTRAISDASFAATGAKTALSLSSFGIKADIVSSKQNGEDLANILNKNISESNKIYWLCGAVTSDEFETNLNAKDSLIKIPCYENRKTNNIILSDEEKSEILSCDGAIFTSGSNAIFGIEVMDGKLPNNIYSIGKFCSKTIASFGFVNISEAKFSSYDGLMEIIR